MGCGASSGESSYQPGEEDDQDDPKLRAYLKARGLDAVDMNNRTPRALRRCRFCLLGSLSPLPRELTAGTLVCRRV